MRIAILSTTIPIATLVLVASLAAPFSDAQQYTISTFAGDGVPTNTGGLSVSLSPRAVATDGVGNVYFAEEGAVYKLAANGVVTLLVGNRTRDDFGGPLGFVGNIAVDSGGNVYIADSSSKRVRKISAQTGAVSVVAGGGSGGDGSLATNAFTDASAVAVNGAGDIFIAEFYNHRIRKVTASTAIISTIAGSGSPGFSGDGGLAVNAVVNGPGDIAVDASGNIYFVDAYNSNRIRKISNTGTITTVVGGGQGDDGGLATAASISPRGIGLSSQGDLYFAELGGRVRRVASGSGIISTVAGSTTMNCCDSALEGVPAVNAPLGSPLDVALDTAGNLFIAVGGLVRKVTANSGLISTVVGGGSAGDGGAASSAHLNFPVGVSVDGLGTVYISDSGSKRVRKVTSGIISNVAGNGKEGFFNPTVSFNTLGNGGPATSARLGFPVAVAVDNAGNIYIADRSAGNLVRRVATGSGTITTFAGGGSSFFGTGGDGGPGASASFFDGPSAIAVDSSGNVYVSDCDRVRKIAAGTGIITTFAGMPGFCGQQPTTSGDGGPATNAQMLNPSALALDSQGSLYVAGGDRIRKVAAGTGVISTVAGGGNGSGEGLAATSVVLNDPRGVAIDSAGNLYILESTANRIRKVTASTGVITTIAGTGAPGFSGDGGNALSARLFLGYSSGIAVDAIGTVYVADYYNQRIRKLTPSATPPLVIITPPQLTSGTVGTPYSQTLAASGGSTPYGWSLVSGTLPTGLSLSNSGAIAGTPSTGGTFTFSFRVADSASATVTQAFALTITPQASGTLAILTSSPLPNGAVGASYSQALTATGGNTPYKGWALASGSQLPPGLAVTAGVLTGTGLLSGTPTSGGAFAFFLQVTDNNNVVVAKAFTLTIMGPPATLAANGIVNSASYAGGSVAPGELVTLFGSFQGPSAIITLQLDSRGFVSTSLGGMQVLFDGVPAPMIYAVGGQASVIVPYGVSGKASTQVQVSYQGQLSNSVAMQVTNAIPGVFTIDASGRGQGAIVNQDGTVNSGANPAAIGSIVLVYATGEGQTNPGGIDGKPNSAPLPQPIAQPVTATVGGVNATVMYAGGVSGLVSGVLQANVQIPQGVSPGNSVSIVLNIGGKLTQSNVTLATR